MSYYDIFLMSNSSPAEKYRHNLQDVVNKQFENASTYWTDIYEEKKFGTNFNIKDDIPCVIENNFKRISARITSLIDAKSGQRVNDDFKKIIFQQNSYYPKYGQRYYFDKNIWIIYSTNNIKNDTSSAYIRRCNNTINIKLEDGSIHCEPCYIDYKITESQVKSGATVDIPSSRIEVVCQKNRYTDLLKINTRFILNKSSYKIRQFIDYNNTETFSDESNYLIKFYANYDLIEHDDNLDNRVADDVTPDDNVPDVPDDKIVVLLNETKTIKLGLKESYICEISKKTMVKPYTYIFDKTENTFSITNLKQSDNPVIIEYASIDGEEKGEISVYLGGVI